MKKCMKGSQCCNQRNMVNFIGFYRLSFQNVLNLAASARSVSLIDSFKGFFDSSS